jgi:hypothetical protein
MFYKNMSAVSAVIPSLTPVVIPVAFVRITNEEFPLAIIQWYEP